jgi:hypothetical protein
LVRNPASAEVTRERQIKLANVGVFHGNVNPMRRVPSPIGAQYNVFVNKVGLNASVFPP